ncbi:MAG: hypothetical protein F6K30_27290 [Cyanothece sp. SIO2G6]|nr:hypothetical protein [Cyanothece sp. SIO2G6]
MVDIIDFEVREKAKLEQILQLASVGKTEESLDLYVEALESFAKYRLFFEGATELRYKDRGGRGDVDFSSSAPNLLLDLSSLLCKIYIGMDALENTRATAYIVEKNQLVIEALSQYKSGFDDADLARYENLVMTAKVINVSANSDIVSDLSTISPEKTDDAKLKLVRIALKTLSETKSCPINLESGGSGCFIATAAYMTESHPDLDTFRQFRDQILLKNSLGRIATSLYYRIGPFLATHIRNNHSLRQLVRDKLALLAKYLRQYIL